MSLTEELAGMREASRKRIPDDKLAIMDTAMDETMQSGITDSTLKVGDIAPDFTLPNAVGESFSLSEMLTEGPVVLSFYRGAW